MSGTHVFSRGELLEVPHGRLHLVLVVADRRGGSAGDAAERRRIRRSRPGRRHLAVGWVGTACGSNVYFLVAVNGEIYLPLRLSNWELSVNYLRVQTRRRDRLTFLNHPVTLRVWNMEIAKIAAATCATCVAPPPNEVRATTTPLGEERAAMSQAAVDSGPSGRGIVGSDFERAKERIARRRPRR